MTNKRVLIFPSFDTDLPKECDDEYWDTPDPAKMFKQPEGKPSKMTAFILTIQLNQILGTCLRTLVSIPYRCGIGWSRSLTSLSVLYQKGKSCWGPDEETVGRQSRFGYRLSAEQVVRRHTSTSCDSFSLPPSNY